MTTKITNVNGRISVQLGDGAPKLVFRNNETDFEVFNITLTKDLIERLHRLLNAAEAFMGDETFADDEK